jgi:hypothetical protein
MLSVLRRFDEHTVIVVKAALEVQKQQQQQQQHRSQITLFAQVFIQLNRRRAVKINDVFLEYAQARDELPFSILVCCCCCFLWFLCSDPIKLVGAVIGQ